MSAILDWLGVNNLVSDENLDEFNGSLNDISADQKSFNEALSKLSEEINSVSANASCEEIGKLNVTEDGYYMIRIQSI